MSASAKLASAQRRSPDTNAATESKSMVWQSSVTDAAAAILVTGGASPSPSFSSSTAAAAVGCAPTFTLAHMELLHHWSTVTGDTATRAPHLHRIWRTDATRVALQHGFLLSALLAFSARHLARLRPQRRAHYDLLAERLQAASLRALNGGRLLLRISRDTSEPLFLFSGITWMNAVAASDGADGGHVLRSCRDWLMFLRGVTAIVVRAGAWLAVGSLGPLLLARPTCDYSKPPPADDPLDDVETLVLSVEDIEKRELYAKILEGLRVAFVRLHYLTKESCFHLDLFQWPSLLPARYIELFMDGEPEALVIFAHYAVLLSQESSVWWLQGRAESIISSIYSHLSPHYRRWVEWPMQQISWNKY
jgi:hypothetical protein